jgi:SOS-response transcriptional repressor LexA
MPKRETLGSRIRQVLDERGMSQSELARLVGVKQQTVSYICADKGAESSRYATQIAEVLGVNPRWLQFGGEGKHDPIVRIEMSGVEIALARVPVLSDDDVRLFIETGKLPESNRRTLMTDARTGPRCFAIELEGESMSPQFIAGDKVVIDPDIAPEPGDYVCATFDGAITFRKYRERGKIQTGQAFELVPMNQDWPIIRSEDGAEIVGVMTEHRTYRRKR